jgi:hypothetical protein
MANPKCDWRVNFRGMRGNVRLRRDTSEFEAPGLEPFSLVPERPKFGRRVSEVYRNEAVAGALSAIRIFQFERRVLTRSTVSKMALATAGSFNTLK